MKETFLHEFSQLAASPDRDLARPALMIARLECAQLDPAPYLHQLDAMGAAARERLRASGCLQDARTSESAIDVLNAYLFDEEGVTGNRERYDDPCNSFLNEVLERRTGIPITPAAVYMEAARRAGHQAADAEPDAAELEADLRAPALVPAGAQRHRAAARGRSARSGGAARSRTAGLPYERLLSGASRSAAVPAFQRRLTGRRGR